MEATTVKRHVQRSPNYPVISLDEALKRIDVVFQKEKRATTTAPVILKHLGYKVERGGLGGRTLSALRQYGLLEEKDGNYKISDLAYSLLHLTGSSERAALLRQAALKPAVFKEVISHYREGLPSDETLRSYLIMKRGFNPDSVGKFIRVFRETAELAKLEAGDYTGGGEGSEEEQTQEGAMPDTFADQERTQPRPSSTAGPIQTFSWALSMPRGVRADLRLSGDLRREDIERLKKHLDLLEEAFKSDDAEG